MKKIFLVGMSVLASGWLAGCSTPQRSAPVVEHPPTASKPPESAKPQPKQVAKPDAHGYYTVKKGDTLSHIAQDVGESYHDIMAWNNLANPNDIKVDQVLRVQPPEGGAHVAGVPAPSTEVKPIPATGTAAPAGIPNKTGPRGDKKPYSEATLAEMQKPDVAAAPGGPAVPPLKPEEKPAVISKPAEKPADGAPGVVEEEGIAWIWPTEGKVITTFDEGRKGIDIAGRLGQPVVAVAAGKVMYASAIRGYGNLVIIKHSNTMVSAYAHNKSMLVKEGQMVVKGQKIAEMGSTDAESVRLHFEIRQQGKPVDPMKLLPSR